MSGDPGAGRFHLASPRNAALLGALVLVLTGALPVVGVLLHTTTGSLTAAVSIVAVILAVAAVGLVVAWHQPGNSIGWLLLAASAWLPLTVVASSYAVYVYHLGHRGLPGLAPLALFVSQQFTFVIVVFPLITLLFPEGRLPSARWRPVLWAYLVLCLSLPVSAAAATAAAFAGHHLRVLSDGSLAAADNPAVLDRPYLLRCRRAGLAGRPRPSGGQLAPFCGGAPPAAQVADQRHGGVRGPGHLGAGHQLGHLGSRDPRHHRAAGQHGRGHPALPAV